MRAVAQERRWTALSGRRASTSHAVAPDGVAAEVRDPQRTEADRWPAAAARPVGRVGASDLPGFRVDPRHGVVGQPDPDAAEARCRPDVVQLAEALETRK